MDESDDLLAKAERAYDDLMENGGLLTEAHLKKSLYITLWQESQLLHPRIERAIDAKHYWMFVMAWTTVWLVPLVMTVPGLAWASWRLFRLKRRSERILALLTTLAEEQGDA